MRLHGRPGVALQRRSRIDKSVKLLPRKGENFGPVLLNVISNYAYVVVLAVVAIFVIPKYFKYLGEAEWGTVALGLSAQGILLLLDMGLGQVVPRNIAQCKSTEEIKSTYLGSLKIYLSTAAVGFVVLQILAEPIALSLSKKLTSNPQAIEGALRLVACQFFWQYPNNANIGYWLGTEKHGRANFRSALFALAKHAGALGLICGYSNTYIAYFLPFVIVGAVEFLFNTSSICRELKGVKKSSAKEDGALGMLKSVGGFSLAISIGLATSQVDRWFLAYSVDAATFGAYVLVSNLALALMNLQAPLQRAFLPRVASTSDPQKQVNHHLRASIALGLTPCLVAALFSQSILEIWLHSRHVSEIGAAPFSLIALAVGLNGIYGPAYNVLLRANRYLFLIYVNAGILLIQVTFLCLYANIFGIVAGGVAWLICGIVQALVAMIVLKRVREFA